MRLMYAKKFFNIMAIGTIIISALMPVNASANENYYTNMNGAVLSQEQYDNLSRVFDKTTIATMSVSLVDSLKDDKNIQQVAQETKYIRQDMVADSEGNTLYTKQYEITENEAENYEEPLQPQSSYSEYSTSVKKICIKIYSASGSEKVVQLTNSWITIPKTKSYDVIALMPGNTSLTDNIDSSSISGYMEYNDGQIVNYSSGSKNIKKSTGLFSGQGGVGISMNIPDTTYKNLKNSMMVKFLSGASPFKVYGTYQHAKSSVSLSESQDYSFSSQGLGGVLKFNKDSIKNKYDGMNGVSLSYTFGEEIYE